MNATCASPRPPEKSAFEQVHRASEFGALNLVKTPYFGNFVPLLTLSHLSGSRSIQESSIANLHKNANKAIVGNRFLHCGNEVYFWADSWAACAAPCRAPRRPGAFASAV